MFLLSMIQSNFGGDLMLNIAEINKAYLEVFPDDAKLSAWSGCNYYINQGTNELEPEGTATSYHDCVGCERIETCTIKKSTRIWKWDKDIESDIALKWNQMVDKEPQVLGKGWL
jgi:hypothetical protein